MLTQVPAAALKGLPVCHRVNAHIADMDDPAAAHHDTLGDGDKRPVRQKGLHLVHRNHGHGVLPIFAVDHGFAVLTVNIEYRIGFQVVALKITHKVIHGHFSSVLY